MHTHRGLRLLLVVALLLPFVAVAGTGSAAPAGNAGASNVITIANTNADERDAAAAYNPASNQWYIAYQSGETSHHRDLSADGQTLSTAVSFDPAGGVRNPLVAVAPNGLAVYPFYDLRFDPPPPNLLAPAHDERDSIHGDASYKRRQDPLPPSQIPIANGPSRQEPRSISVDPATVAFMAFFLQQVTLGAPARLMAKAMPNGVPTTNTIAVSDGTANASRVDSTFLNGQFIAAFLQNANIVLAVLTIAGLIDIDTALDLQEDIEDVAIDALIVNSPFLAMAYIYAGPEAARFLAFDLLDAAALPSTNALTVAQGQAPAPLIIRDQNRPSNPDIACFNGENPRCLIVWQERGEDDQRDIWGVFYANSALGSPFPIANTAHEERDPYVAVSPNDTFLVLWNEGEDPNRDVKAMIITEPITPPATPTPTVTPTVDPDATATPTPTVTPTSETPDLPPVLFLPLIRR